MPGIREYAAEFKADKAWGPDEYLADKGLIPLPDADRKSTAAAAQSFNPLSM